MSTPVLWMLFFAMPGVSAAMASAMPLLSALLVLWCVGWVVVHVGFWVMDDTWKQRRDALRQQASAITCQATPCFPTSRRALGQALAQGRIQSSQRLRRQPPTSF
jgi:hypothetical protein